MFRDESEFSPIIEMKVSSYRSIKFSLLYQQGTVDPAWEIFDLTTRFTCNLP